MARNSQVLLDLGQGLSIPLGLPKVSTWNTKDRPDEARQGVLGFNVDTNSLEYYDGKRWLRARLRQN